MNENSGIANRLNSLCMSPAFSDVNFVVGKPPDTKTFPAHRLILSLSSPVFKAMFNGKFDCSKSEYELPDECPEAFELVLVYIYSDQVQLNEETALKTIYSAKKYALITLEKKCFDFLLNNITTENVFVLHENAIFYEKEDLIEKCLDFIDREFYKLIENKSILSYSAEALKKIVIRDTLYVKEIDLFEAIVAWAEAECDRCKLKPTPENKRKVLIGILDQIRFPLIRKKVFAERVVSTNILTDKQTIDLFVMLTLNKKSKIALGIQPRFYLPDKEFVLERFLGSLTNTHTRSNRSLKCIYFEVDTDIFLTAIDLFGPCCAKNTYFNCRLYDARKTYAFETCTLNEIRDQVNIRLAKPVEIKANSKYHLFIQTNQDKALIGSNGKETYEVQTDFGQIVKFKFYEYDDCHKPTSVLCGIVKSLIFQVS